MAILTGKEILRRRETGDITITPFDEKRVNPNSYNLTLAPELMVYKCHAIVSADLFGMRLCDNTLDMAKENAVETIEIDDGGFVIQPGVLYLARTAEYTETHNLVPMLEGRSSIGRLGINIHATAGFGDVGFSGFWTLEISCVQPVRIYPGVEICQIYYHTVEGEISEYSSGKYQKNSGIQPSMLWKDRVRVRASNCCGAPPMLRRVGDDRQW